jgi:hypothetical protein
MQTGLHSLNIVFPNKQFDTIISDHCLLTILFIIRNAIKESRNFCCFSQKPKFNYELF